MMHACMYVLLNFVGQVVCELCCNHAVSSIVAYIYSRAAGLLAPMASYVFVAVARL